MISYDYQEVTNYIICATVILFMYLAYKVLSKFFNKKK